jgi:NAD(P)-dependent dehydrogenase (short-subunit alcohol dehydrogenase family)
MTDPLTALVTGANKGLGKEVARQLGRLGATVLIGSRDHARGELAAAELVAQGLAAHAIQLDVTEAASIQAAAGEVQTRYGRLDVLVNNAGILVAPPALETTVEDLRATFETNVFGVLAVTRAMLPPRHFKINAATPGHIATDLNGHSGPRTPEQGARIVVELATLPDDGPSGGFFNDDGQLPW